MLLKGEKKQSPQKGHLFVSFCANLKIPPTLFGNISLFKQIANLFLTKDFLHNV
jgi:hypothetical protein